ncbi:MAG: hypothetical protein PHO27_00960 [Sulfuricurvum sp.]|nr:hypothetical protein [Sulfuricurvum sp.]
MNTAYNGYLQVLAHKKRILVFDDDTVVLRMHPEFLEAFDTYNCYSATETTDTHLISILTVGKIDAVIIESANPSDTLRICRHINQYDWKIALVVIVPDGALVPEYRESNAIVDTMLCRPFEQSVLIKKMVTALAAKQAMMQLSHSLGLESLLNDQGDIETFKNTFEGNILLICETLKNHAQRLENGELSPELFKDIANSVEKISQIFSHHHYTKHVAKIFDNLALYLEQYDFSNTNISVLEGFDFLTKVVEDIIVYMKDFFINRIFSDVYVFEHSLDNSIEFMKNHLESRADTQSEMEFFE